MYLQVLGLVEGEVMGWGWASYGEVPSHAVPCYDNVSPSTISDGQEDANSNTCYLGVSMYSDGICSEAPGKIEMAENMIKMSIGRKQFECPFFMFLTIKSASEKEDVVLDYEI